MNAARRLLDGSLFVAALAATLFAPASIACAADEDTITPRVAALEAKVATDTTAKSLEALKEDLDSAVALYGENAKKDPNRERILRILGGFTTRKDAIAKAALVALGNLGDTAGAKYLRPYLRPVDDKSAPPNYQDDALEAAKKLPDDSNVEFLLVMVDDSKNIKVAAKAMDTLSTYGGLKKSREKILDRLVKSVMKSHSGKKRQNPDNLANPDAGTGNSNNQGPAERWSTLSEALPLALNAMTGQNETSTESWSDLVSANRGRLGELFRR